MARFLARILPLANLQRILRWPTHQLHITLHLLPTHFLLYTCILISNREYLVLLHLESNISDHIHILISAKRRSSLNLPWHPHGIFLGKLTRQPVHYGHHSRNLTLPRKKDFYKSSSRIAARSCTINQKKVNLRSISNPLKVTFID